ncbi:hypothetical protein VTK26DRAFT_1047 [Humicola hyalothermophila]
MAYVAPDFPWKLTALMLNTLLGSYNQSDFARIEDGGGSEHFPMKKDEPVEGSSAMPPSRRPLPDDFALRGFPWVDRYFPDGWFATREKIDDDDKYFEVPSMIQERKERALWLGCRIAKQGGGNWLTYDRETHRFDVSPLFDVDILFKRKVLLHEREAPQGKVLGQRPTLRRPRSRLPGLRALILLLLLLIPARKWLSIFQETS